MSNLVAFLQTLESRNDWCVEYPLHGMANEVLTRDKSREYQVCVVLRSQSTNARERSADLETIKELKDRLGPDGLFDIEMDASDKDVLLRAAARALSCHPPRNVLEETKAVVNG
jgi:hypothetical protein